MSEIDPEAVAFHEEAFGIGGIVSSSDPSAFRAPRVFDAVLAASFFSHVPAGSFKAWLSALWRCVAPGGLLLFSTHGPDLLKEPADWSQGIVFRAESETRRLDPAVYGTTWVTRDYVTRKVAGATGGESRVAFIPFGLCAQQDVTLVARPPGLPQSPAALPLFPRGDLDRFEVTADAMEAEGWVEAKGEVEISFFVGSAVRAREEPKEAAAGRRRWESGPPERASEPTKCFVLRRRLTDSPTLSRWGRFEAWGRLARLRNRSQGSHLRCHPERQRGICLVVVFHSRFLVASLLGITRGEWLLKWTGLFLLIYSPCA